MSARNYGSGVAKTALQGPKGRSCRSVQPLYNGLRHGKAKDAAPFSAGHDFRTPTLTSAQIHSYQSSVCQASQYAAASAHILGWLVIAGSWLRSVPQIIRIAKTRSIEGISIVAVVVETLCYTVIIGYNVNHRYVLSTYGDVFACWLQDLVICGMLAWYRKPTLAQMTTVGLSFLAFNWWVISGTCGMEALVAMQVMVGVVMSLGARVPQIVLNIKRGNTGELAIITFALSTIGNLIRCFTTIVLTSDVILLATTAAQALLNGIITVQCLQTEIARRQAAGASVASSTADTA